MSSDFDYNKAFSRNIGWVTQTEQQLLSGKRVAIAGMGGVGGSHLLTLVRLGISKFHIADFDTFELANFNRQAGARMSSLGKPKADELAQMARDINPDVDIKIFNDGVHKDNLKQFLSGIDIYVDGLDFFVIDIRRLIFDTCTQLNIPAITAAPLGMGTALLSFLPGKMTFEDYFQLDGLNTEEQLIHFLVGLSPARLQNAYLVEPEAVDLVNHKGPSTIMACELCAGAAATQVLKILLQRGHILAAPWGMHFDAYRNKLSKTWRPGGNKNPLQRLAIAIGRRKFLGKLKKL